MPKNTEKLSCSYRACFRYLLAVSMVCLATSSQGHAENADTEVLNLSVEELMQVEVYSVSKKTERAQHAPAAVFVLTETDIRRSGATSIPELLRLVPGLHVGRISNDTWAISSRGFNGRFTNKLLVLIDGRSVYTPIFSGVYWNDLDLMLEDIKQIEVIRGPGGTLWGANAVNGVVNIITKNAADTQGGLASVGGGDEDRLIGAARYGSALGENGHIRLFTKYRDRGDSHDAAGANLADQTESGLAGMRADWALPGGDKLSLDGGFYRLFEGSTYEKPVLAPALTSRVTDTANAIGAHALAEWISPLSEISEVRIKGYVARNDREQDFINFWVNTYDVEVQHSYALTDSHKLVWGAGYRLISDEIEGKELVSFIPAERDADLLSLFAQDEITLQPDTLSLTVGTKLEHNDYTGGEIQPNLRLLYSPNTENTFWAAWSRAVRTPSRADDDVLANFAVTQVPQVGFAGIVIAGQDEVRSETLLAYELGYRYSPSKEVNFDLTAFYFDYDDISTVKPSQEIPFGVVNGLPSLINNFTNGAAAQSYGAEIAMNAQVRSWWRTRLWYAYLDQVADLPNGSSELLVVGSPGTTPNHQVSVGTFFDLAESFELNGDLRYVSKINGVDPYFELNLGVNWAAWKDVEFSVYGQSLLHNHHSEFATESFPNPTGTEIERGVFGKVVIKF